MTENGPLRDSDFLVLGGTGKTGRRVVERLRERGLRVRVASRSAEGGRQRFVWEEEETWGPALAGVGAVYLVPPGELTSPESARAVEAFAARAVAAGVRRIVLLSAREEAELLDGERAVRDSGVAEWTVLRPSWFAQNFSEDFFHPAVVGGHLRLSTGAGQEPFIDVEDIADVAVVALTEDGHAGQTYALSGPRLLTFGEAVAEIARATGRDITYTPLDEEQFVAEWTAAGVPPHLVEVLRRLFALIREGKNAHLSDGVQRVLGREPRDITDYVNATAATGVWAAPTA
ncbi:NAD(P)H-binding protein [Streptomyces sp. NPDC057702]|uniref:NAD(P)H-binding protein n=1 Tax=unclassified Streptomyces TaxID=2593676 RepID=UPI003679E0D4